MRGQELHPNEVIALQPGGSKTGFINIGLLDGTILTRNCSRPADCTNVAISIPSVRLAPSLRDRARALFEHLFDHGQPPVIFEMSRGESVEGPGEAVLLKDSQGVDFSSSLKNVAAGEYQLRVTPVSYPSGGPALRPLKCAWFPPKANCTADREFAEGLYRLEVRNGTHTVGSAVPILIVSPERYAERLAVFSDIEHIASFWEGQARPETIHYLLSAALFHLAQQ